MAGDPNLELVGIVVAAITLVDVDTRNFDACHSFHVGNDRPQSMAVEGIAVQRLAVQDELAALGLGDGSCNRDLAAELVGSPRFSFADALDLGSVQGVDLGPALAVVLVANLDGKGDERREAVL